MHSLHLQSSDWKALIIRPIGPGITEDSGNRLLGNFLSSRVHY